MPTHFNGTEKEKKALNIYIKLLRASESLSSRVNSHIGKRLTISQFSTLEALYHLGPLYQKELGDKLLKSGGNITLVIDNLEKQGLVKRERSSKDRRNFNIHLTEQGKNLIGEIFPKHVEAIVNEFSVLNDAEQSDLERLLKKVGLKKKPGKIP